jgi:hypothetical protein
MPKPITIDNYFAALPEPQQSAALALMHYALHFSSHITCYLSYGVPFFAYKGKRFMFVNMLKQNQQLYLAFTFGPKLNSPFLDQGKRASMSVLVIDHEQDLPIEIITPLITQCFEYLTVKYNLK